VSSSIELRGITVSARLDGVSLKIAAGESVAFVGRSGAGKTTALRLVNGLVVPTRGEVLIDDVPLARTDLVALRRRTGYIIQGSGLFPHQTVFDNIATIPRLLEWDEGRTRERIADVMMRIAMPVEKFGARYPRSLSGGEQQRVGIARAIVANPSILLCDEPFGALDPIVRRELQDAFRALRSDATIVFVTHDLVEAMRVCERIVLFDQGRIVSDSPSSAFPNQSLQLVREFVAAASLPS